MMTAEGEGREGKEENQPLAPGKGVGERGAGASPTVSRDSIPAMKKDTIAHWTKVTVGREGRTMYILTTSFALLASIAMAYAQPVDCSRESQRLYATCADATERFYQQHRRVLRDANIPTSRLDQDRQRDLDSCRATADAFRTNCLGR